MGAVEVSSDVSEPVSTSTSVSSRSYHARAENDWRDKKDKTGRMIAVGGERKQQHASIDKTHIDSNRNTVSYE